MANSVRTAVGDRPQYRGLLMLDRAPAATASFVGRHAGAVGVALPAFALAVFVLNCLVLADFNPTVAGDLIELANPADVVRRIAGTIFEFAVLFVPSLCLAVGFARWKLERPPWSWSIPVAVALLGIVLTVFINFDGLDIVAVPTTLAAFGAAGAIIERTTTRQANAGQKTTWIGIKQFGWALLAVALVAVTLTTGISGGMWRPPERITAGGGAAFTGYVTDESDTDLIVFVDSGMPKLQRLAKSIIRSRQLCSVSNHRAGLPLCPRRGR
jgi:hypothetical protein